MLVPIVIGAIVIGLWIGKSKMSFLSIGNSSTRESTRESEHVGRRLPSSTRPTPQTVSPIELLKEVIRRGRQPKEWLVIKAVEEAFRKGDMILADAILTAFEKRLAPEKEPPISEAPASPPTVATDAPASVPVDSVPPAPEPRSYSSPIEGVEDDDWSMFANSMRIHPPEFETDRHIGIFHQRKDRLKQLQLSPSKDEEEQYRAFVRDCLDHLNHKKLLGEHVTTVIKVRGEDHVVTASGFLGLMKAAGPKNAVHWIQNPEEREKFPHTTEIFLRCNNCF